MPGDWMSVSITPTRRPCAASSAARFAVVFDLPVPPRYECTETMDIRARAYRGRDPEASAFTGLGRAIVRDRALAWPTRRGRACGRDRARWTGTGGTPCRRRRRDTA